MVNGEEMLRSTTTKYQRHTMDGGHSCSKACIGSTFNHKGYQKSPRKCELFSLVKLVRLVTIYYCMSRPIPPRADKRQMGRSECFSFIIQVCF